MRCSVLGTVMFVRILSVIRSRNQIQTSLSQKRECIESCNLNMQRVIGFRLDFYPRVQAISAGLYIFVFSYQTLASVHIY